jgi:hypothetical protein
MNRIVGLFLIVVYVICCAGGTETGNPFRPIPIELQVRSTDPQTVAISQGTGGTVIEQAWFAIGVISFIREGQCSEFAEIDYPVGESLVTADFTDEKTVVEIDIESGSYCGVIVTLQKRTTELPDGAPPELGDHSVVLVGQRADGVSFILAHPEQDELEIINQVSGPFSVGPSEDPLSLSFDMAILLKDVNLDAAELDPDGTIHIDEQSNRELLDGFEYNLECALTLYTDADDNGELDTNDTLLATCEDEEDEDEYEYAN